MEVRQSWTKKNIPAKECTGMFQKEAIFFLALRKKREVSVNQ